MCLSSEGELQLATSTALVERLHPFSGPSMNFSHLFSRVVAVLVLGLMVCPTALADTPLPPPDAAVKECSLNGQFYLSRAQGSQVLKLHAVDAKGRRQKQWEVRNMARFFEVANDGEHWVQIFDGANLLPLNLPETVVMLTFHRRAETIAMVELRQFVRKPKDLPRTVSHQFWGRYGFDQEGRFKVQTAESVEFLFDVSTGKPINRQFFR